MQKFYWLSTRRGGWILFISLILSLQSRAYTQDSAQITIHVTNTSIETVFKQIEKQTGLTFYYAKPTLDGDQPVSVDLRGVGLTTALNAILKGKNVGWVVRDRAVVLNRKVLTNDNKLDSVPRVNVSGQVTDPKGNPIAGATISLKGQSRGQSADNLGRFQFANIPANSSILVSSIGYESKQIKLSGETTIRIQLDTLVREIKGVEIVSTGYQMISKEKATGSFVKIENDLLNRRTSTGILDRLDGITSGLIFNRNKQAGNGNEANIQIRGRSTIFANAEPLIVLDNFPFEGDINDINPNDILSITILKDAAAASIWGVRASNGVIVITSKTGSLNHTPKISFNTNLTIGNKPNLYYQPQLSSSDFLEVEKFLYNKGAYDFYLTSPSFSYYPLSPAIEIMDKKKKKQISEDDATKLLNDLSSIDVRKNYEKYFLQKSISQQYSISLSGGGINNRYYLSGGYDKNRATQIGNNFERFTFNANNTNYLLEKKFELFTKIFFASTNRKSSTGYSPKYPYERIIDNEGNPLPVVAEQRLSYIDTAGNGKLLDWGYYPLNERVPRSINKTTDFRLDLGISYTIIKELKAAILFQYGKTIMDGNSSFDQNSYLARNLINRYTAINYTTGTLLRGIPLGGIETKTTENLQSNYARAQLSYENQFKGYHSISLLAGAEIRDAKGQSSSQLQYGYDPKTATAAQIDYFKDYTLYDLGYTSRIPYSFTQSGSTDRFRSLFINGAYTFDNKITISGSARSDESNLFGVDANKKRIPLWSIGGSWEINKEGFYNSSLLPFLKVRISNGYNGNIDRTLSAFITASTTSQVNIYSLPIAVVINPPNPQLRWEKVRITNFGVDFGSKNNIITGSFEFYIKSGKDLIGNSPLAPQTGIIQFKGNTANMRTKGVDVILNTTNINRHLVWSTNFLLSYVTDKITKYLVKQGSNSNYIQQNFSNPLEGKPYSAIFSYRWAGLDTLGRPQSLLDGKITTNYSAVVNSTNVNELVYMGPASPMLFGSLRNNFVYKGVDFSFNITYKLGYFFRRQSLNYSSLFNGVYQQADFSKRWMQRGDEIRTNVPSMYYYPDGTREDIYNYSDILVEKGDHIRLQDIQLGYALPSKLIKKGTVKGARIYFYASNIGIIWRANKYRIDPDANAPGTFPTPATFSFGINVNL